MDKNTMINDEKITETDVLVEETTQIEDEEDIFSNIRYICNSTSLITESLQAGWDVAQLPNGDIIVTEVVTINMLYTWDKNKQKMVKISQS